MKTLTTEHKPNSYRLNANDFIRHYRQRIDNELQQRLAAEVTADKRLQEAMSYSLLSGGKRIRPLLAYASALAIDDCHPLTDTAAAAIECIHSYSLIHDDLPAMDNDELRRGQPTCHIAFDEATAILAGDALQSLAFEWLSEPVAEQHNQPAQAQLTMVHILATASGDKGMGAGQAVDLAAVNRELDESQLRQMHRLKTGALITASVKLGALSTMQASAAQIDALTHYADAIGLAFQVQDDILDITADTSTLGKQQGADQAHNKPTFVSALGLKAAQQQARQLYEEALSALGSFDYRADYLRHLAAYIVKRPY